MSDDERAIRQLIATWMAATKAGDHDAVLGLMTDDVVFMVPGREPFGKAAFAAASKDLQDLAVDGTSDIGANLFLAYLFPMGERMKVRIEIEDYISSAGFEVGTFETDGQLQNDLVLSGGVMIPF